MVSCWTLAVCLLASFHSYLFQLPEHLIRSPSRGLCASAFCKLIGYAVVQHWWSQSSHRFDLCYSTEGGSNAGYGVPSFFLDLDHRLDESPHPEPACFVWSLLVWQSAHSLTHFLSPPFPHRLLLGMNILHSLRSPLTTLPTCCSTPLSTRKDLSGLNFIFAPVISLSGVFRSMRVHEAICNRQVMQSTKIFNGRRNTSPQHSVGVCS